MSHMPLITKTDIGYNLSFQNGSYNYYIGEQKKNNGVSYKNHHAFYTGVGICYISEAAFENETGIEQKRIQQYTDILKSFKVNYEFVLSSNEVNDFSYTSNDIQQLIIKTIELEWKKCINLSNNGYI